MPLKPPRSRSRSLGGDHRSTRPDPLNPRLAKSAPAGQRGNVLAARLAGQPSGTDPIGVVFARRLAHGLISLCQLQFPTLSFQTLFPSLTFPFAFPRRTLARAIFQPQSTPSHLASMPSQIYFPLSSFSVGSCAHV